MEITKENFKEKLRIRREQYGLSRKQFALQVGVSAMAIYDWEKGNRMPRIPTLKIIADVLGLDREIFDFLIEKKEEKI